MDVGDLISHLRLDNKPFKKALRQSSQEAKAAFGMTEKVARESSRSMGRSYDDFSRRSVAAGNRMAKGWWKTFGKVAVGFTIAYRAMNAFEEGLKALIRTFVSGRQVIDDFRMAIVEVAASLQMLTEQPSIEGLEAYYKFAKAVFEDLEIIAAKHISTGEDLRNAYAKLATMGIVPQTEVQLEQMARLVDLVIIQTKGLDKQRQLRTEIQALVLGEMRQGAVVARMMSQRIANFDDLIERMEEETDVAEKTKIMFEGIGKVLDAVGSVSKDIQKTHTALWTTLMAVLNKIQRAGLLQMYEDLLSLMIGIRDTLMDQNGLTEQATVIAWTYHKAWATTWNAIKPIALILADIVYWSNKLLGFTAILKGWAGLIVIISAGMEKINALIMQDLYDPLALYNRLLDINTRMDKALTDIFITQEEFRKKYMKGLKTDLEELRKFLEDLRTGTKDIEFEIKWGEEKITEEFWVDLTHYAKKYRLEMEVLNKAVEIFGKKGKKTLEAWTEAVKEAYIEIAKLRSAIEYAPPFDWEEWLDLGIDTMEAYIAKAKELAALEYAPPFDWEEWLPSIKRDLSLMEELYKNYLANVQSAFADAFSDLFFDAMKGKFEDWKDYVLAILDSILRALTDLYAQMVALEIMKKTAKMWAGGTSFGASMHGGGIIGQDRGPFRTVPISTFADVPRAHTGLLPSEIPIIARRDEGIFTPAQMKALGKSEGDNYNIVINAVDAKSFADLTNRNPQAILNPFKKALRSGDRELRGAIRNTV